jgi:glycosyltransferase involved in cell wall biosynthesis
MRCVWWIRPKVAPDGSWRQRVLYKLWHLTWALGTRGVRGIRGVRRRLASWKSGLYDLGRRLLPFSLRRWLKWVVLRRSPFPKPTPYVRTEMDGGQWPTCYDVFVFPIIDWDFRFQRPQQIIRQFARNGHRVFYIRTTFHPVVPGHRPVLTQTVDSNVLEVRLPGPSDLNVYHHRPDAATVETWVQALDYLRWEAHVAEAVCIVQLPFWRALAVRLRERFGWRVVYDCMDWHAGFSTNEPAMLQEEEGLTRASDLVLVTSRRLLEEQKRYNPNCRLVPNACDFDHFSVSLAPPPEALAGLPRPLIGYYGAISDWFDTTLVADVARRRPEWSFVLIGSTFGADLTPLQGLSNVHLLGEQPYSALPAYLHAFDVCIIPFRLTPLTEATNPVKLYEYLSAGKPVVSVPLPEIEAVASEGLVYTASGAEAWVQVVERALREDTPERQAARRHFARQNTWEIRWATIRPMIEALYPRVSIVVLTYNNLHLTRLCIESLYRSTVWPNWELIVVDNASTDGTREYLQEVARCRDNVRIFLNERNEGFARGNNRGIQAATGEYIVLLNNDTIVTRGWLGRLVRHVERDPGGDQLVTDGRSPRLYSMTNHRVTASWKANDLEKDSVFRT